MGPSADRDWARLLHGAALLAGSTAVVVALLVSLGWVSGERSLVSLRATWPPMAPTTAAMTFLAGAALMRATRAGGGASQTSGAARGLGVAIVVVALAVLLEAALQTRLGDALPARTSPQTATAFVLLGSALSLLDGRAERTRLAGEACAFAAMSVAFIAIAGYVYAAPALYGVPAELPRIGMAVHTGAVILLIALGALAAHPDCVSMRAMTTGDGGRLARRLLLVVLGFPAVSALIVLAMTSGVITVPAARGLTVFAATASLLSVVVVTARRVNDLSARQREATLARDQVATYLEELVSSAPDGIFIADLTGRYIDVNPAGARLLGFTPGEIIGKTIADFIRPEDVPRLAAAKKEMLTGKSHVAEWSLRHKDGHYVPVEVSANILPDGRWQGFARDVTERVAALRELERAHRAEHEAKLRVEQMLGASSEISDALAQIPTTGLNIALQAVAMQAQLLTGGAYAALGIGNDPDRPFDPWVVVGMPEGTAETIGRFPRPRGMLALSARFQQTVRLADIRTHPEARGLPPGHPPIVSLMSTPVRYAGKVVGNIYVANKQGSSGFSDDDERALLMLAARAGAGIESARLYAREATGRVWLQTVFDQMPEIVVVTNARGEVILHSSAAGRLVVDARDLGIDRIASPRSPRSADGRPLSLEEHPLYRVLMLDEHLDGVEIALPQTDGTLVSFRMSAKRIPLENGQGGAIAVLQDIRPFKELERLRQEWASIVAHDLRQPISTIHAGALLLLDHCRQRDDTKETADLIERIQRATTRLARMTEDLLDISRIEAKQLQIVRSPVDLREVLDRAAGAARIVYPDRCIDLSAAHQLLVLADAGRIEQVLSNLIGNAVKYGDPSTAVEVEARQAGDDIEVIVSNGGPGIPAEELPRLFDRFARSREARKSGKPGLGLGLYIAKGLIQAHGGRIWVESVPGKTSFHFTIPSVVERASGEQPAVLPDRRPTPKVA